MSEKQIIAILGGTGNEGPGLAMRWAHAGYGVIIGSREAEKAQRVARELNEKLGIESIRGMENTEAARTAEICVLTVVQSAHQSALEGLKEALQGKILVDATARIGPPDFTPPGPPSAARVAQDILGEQVKVAAAFQNVPASALKMNLDKPVEADVLVCASDKETAEVVIGLVEGARMRGYYAGGLENGVVVEGITALLIQINKHYGGHASIRVAGAKK